jgi:hypothetical protein
VYGPNVPDALIPHLEAHLGPIVGGWSEDNAGVRLPFHVVHFADAPASGLVTYSTLGLSRHVLGQKTAGDVRQELLLIVRDREKSGRLVSALAALGELVAERHRAIPRGAAVPMGAPLLPGSLLDTFYVAEPVLLAPDFAVRLTATVPPTVFAWLVPIAASELALIDAHGWGWFEDRLAEQKRDLTDLHRAKVVHE